MRYAVWAVAAWQVLNVFVTIGLTGKPRKPVTPAVTAVSTAISAAIAVVLVLAGMRL